MPIVIYAIGSPIVVDVAETCRRLGVEIAAWVRNVEGDSYAPQDAVVLAPARVPQALLPEEFTVPLFTPRHRLAVVTEARRLGFSRPATLVDPTAVVASTTVLGAGSYVNTMANIGAASRLGEFCFVNRSAVIGHHAEIEDFVSIGPGATLAGMTRVGRGAMIGAGAVVLPRMEIGSHAVIAAGAVVTRAVAPRTLVAGNPARLVRELAPSEIEDLG